MEKVLPLDLGRKFVAYSLLCIFTMALFVPVSVRAESGFSGMFLQGIDERAAKALGLKSPKGVLIRDLALGEPASLAGLQRGDLIISYAGEDIETLEQLAQVASKTRPDQEVKVVVIRWKRKKAFTMKLGKRSGAWNVTISEIVVLSEIGVTLSAITPEIRKRFKIRWGALGVLVTLVDEEMKLKMPLERNDVIVQVGQRNVSTPRQIETYYHRAQKEAQENLLILVERMGSFQFMLLPVEKKS